MRSLDRKLLRELRRHWVQIVSIALVMGCGTMTIMGLRSTLTSIRAARDTYFDEYRFPDVFARLERAPNAVGSRIGQIPGVSAVETRIVRDVRLDVPGLAEPAIGHMVSIPDVQRPMLNELLIRRGRWIAPRSTREVLVSDRFAEVNHLTVGDSLSAVINGRWQRLEIVGVAISPEFVVEYAGSGLFVDNRRYGIVWASRALLGGAFDMNDAFNDVAVRLVSAAAQARVESDVDQLLRAWGGAPSFGRTDQPAARVLEDEFGQLRTNATIFPLFFLLVAAFLLNVVLSRLVASQREEIAALKAFGYTDRQIGGHYLGFGIAAVALGAAVGIPAGAWMGIRFSALYQDYFRFPSVPSVLDWGAAATGVGVSGGFALLGAFSGVRRVMRLAPADALRPEAPSRFRRLSLEVIGLGPMLSPAVRMVLRNIERRPLRTASTTIGVALAVALLASGRFPYDALDRLMVVEFRLIQRYDALAAFTQATPARAALDLQRVDGVIATEPFRVTSVRIRRGVAMRTTTISGIEPHGRLFRLVDVAGHEFNPPATGCVLSRWLGAYLGVHVGDTILVDLLEQGSRQVRVAIAGIFDPMVGQGIYMSRAALNRVLREQDLASGSYLAIAPGRETDVMARMKDYPRVAGVVSRAATIRSMDEQMRQSMVFVLAMIITSACIIALGVVYNSARIALSERGRELASLRVLGFTTGEVSGMLLGEQAAVMLVALPLGILFGFVFSVALVHGFDTERFQFPFVIALRSQLLAVGVVLGAAAVAGLVVNRRVGRLNMVTALRTRE